MPVSVGDDAITTSGSIFNSFSTGVLVTGEMADDEEEEEAAGF